MRLVILFYITCQIGEKLSCEADKYSSCINHTSKAPLSDYTKSLWGQFSSVYIHIIDTRYTNTTP